MMFTTPCFVRVEDAEKRKKLAEWLELIGYECAPHNKALVGTHVIAGTAFFCFVSFANGVRPHYGRNGIDCGTNIKLFKALAAMNDENAYMQYFVYLTKGYISHISTLGGWWLCTKQRWIDWAKPRFLNSMALARKATAEEIIDHFNNRKRWKHTDVVE